MTNTPYAWPCNALDMALKVSDANGLEWDDTSLACLMAEFIEEHCSPAAFEEFLHECATFEAST